MQGTVGLSGTLVAKKLYKRAPLLWQLRNRLTWRFIGGWVGTRLAQLLSNTFHILTVWGELRIKHISKDGWVTDYGVVGYRSITTAFVTLAVDQLQTETSVWGDFKYHDSGVGTTAENVTDTAMETTDGESRATGTQTESAAAVYVSVGTINYTTTKAITEHGLFNASTGVTLLDRTVFTAVNVVSGDSIQFTYSGTWATGG